MPSTYSSNLLLELMADGEKDTLWGAITNENLEILGRAVSGVTTVSLAGTTHTLTVSQGALSEGHYAVLELGGSPTGTNTITINPNTVDRIYLVKNSSGQNAIFTQGSGGNVTVANGDTAIIYSDGAGAGAKVTELTADFMRGSNNLSDIDSAATALTNLGLTATAAELNTLDGLTATTAELNKLDGLTSSTAELNILDGVTWTLTDYNTLTSTAVELNKLDGFTGTFEDLNYAKDLRATGVTTTEFDKLDGLSATTTELNYVSGVTSSIQTQLDGKAANTTQAEATWEAGTGTTESLVSPAKVKAAIEANVGDSPVKAWVNFNGTGTVSIRESFNVSSITDNGTGNYTVNFETALTDANYVISLSLGFTPAVADGRHFAYVQDAPPSNSAFTIGTRSVSGGVVDRDFIYATISR